MTPALEAARAGIDLSKDMIAVKELRAIMESKSSK